MHCIISFFLRQVEIEHTDCVKQLIRLLFSKWASTVDFHITSVFCHIRFIYTAHRWKCQYISLFPLTDGQFFIPKQNLTILPASWRILLKFNDLIPFFRKIYHKIMKLLRYHLFRSEKSNPDPGYLHPGIAGTFCIPPLIRKCSS